MSSSNETPELSVDFGATAETAVKLNEVLGGGLPEEKPKEEINKLPEADQVAEKQLSEDEQKEKELIKKLIDAQAGRPESDIHIGDPYWKVRQEVHLHQYKMKG